MEPTAEPIQPIQPAEPTGTVDTPSTGSVDWRAVLRGAATGLLVVVVAAVLRAVLGREVDDFNDTGWVYPLFVVVLLGYGTAGWVAARRASRGTPLMHGALGGLAVIVIWLPVRALIWLVRDEHRALFRGSDAALRPGQVFGHIVIAAGLGMLGGFLADRVDRRRRAVTG